MIDLAILNTAIRVTYYPKAKSTEYVWDGRKKTTLSQKVTNLFKKEENKVFETSTIIKRADDDYNIYKQWDNIDDFLKDKGDQYQYNKKTNIIARKSHVTIEYGNDISITRDFNKEEDAKLYLEKIMDIAKENNIALFDFNA